MRWHLIWLMIIVVAKTVLLQGRAAAMVGDGTDYLVVVGTLLMTWIINWLLVGGYAILVKPRRWRVILGLLVGLTVFDYAVAEGVIYIFGITP